MRSLEDFNNTEKFTKEQFEIIPRIIIDNLDELDEMFKCYVTKEKNNNLQELYDLRKELERNLDEFTALLTTAASENILIEKELGLFTTQVQELKEKIQILSEKRSLNDEDIFIWDELQETFIEKITVLRKLLTDDTLSTTTPNSSLPLN